MLVQASPMQVARATAALATGVLPDVRLVRSVAGVPVRGASRPLGVSEASLRFVRDALRAVVEDPEGSAYRKGLDAGTLGFSFACKTGSADIGPIVEVPGMPDDDRDDMAAGKARKHTWVAGWFPADDPCAVLVVYLHHTTETSSHTAVHVASQFLRSEAVRRLVAGRRGG
jgi:cell division protein FtsI/penicillin-binding protein 2